MLSDNPEAVRSRLRRLNETPDQRASRVAAKQRWESKNRERMNHHRREWARRTGEDRKQQVKRYGLTLDQFDALLTAQEGKCAICSIEMTTPHIDHCHATGVVRGLLCQQCNHGVGNFRDQPDLLEAAISYLRKEPGT